MAEMHRVGSLEIDQDLEFERREWTFQRVAWLVMALLLLIGLAGFLGNGPIGQTTATSGPLTIEYNRFIHKRAPSELHLLVDPGAASEGEIALWVSKGFFDKYDVRGVVPEPTEMEAAPDRTIFRFTVADAQQPVAIFFQLEAAEPGFTDGRLGLVDGEEIAFNQLIYP